MKINDIMTKGVISVKATESVAMAAKTMLDNDIGGLPVIDEQNNLVGMITESDFIGKKVDIPHAMVSMTQLLGQTHYNADILQVFDKCKNTSVQDVMSKKLYTLSSSATLTDANYLLLSNEISRIPIVDDNKLVGIVTKRDILKVFSSSINQHARAQVV